ncbi:hypothetical protein CL656_02795, partial [bacterium]|nr:hypothetical protein [bacterium]
MNFERYSEKQKIQKPLVLLVTGVLGSGKTTFLVNLLNWLKNNDHNLPPVIVNDRGTQSNLDYSRVNQIEGVDAVDLHGQCIGCGGRDEFVDIIKNTRQELIIVEP